MRRWVFVGGLHERKGVMRLVRAFVSAAREDAEVSLTLFGSGALADALIGLARDGGVADRLHLPGVVRHRELLAQLPSYDVLLAPSTYGPFTWRCPRPWPPGCR
ncbi:MAG: glycosyltransferase [Kineosporiaceae bacterium]